MAIKELPTREDLAQELKEMEDRLSCKQSAMRNAPERSRKRFPRFTISTELSCRSMFGEIAPALENELKCESDSD
jgi:hypothetical protein